MVPWAEITFFGDTVVLLPAAIAIAAWLVVGRAWRIAAFWCIMFSAGLMTVAATKIAFIGWGIGVRSLDFTGISGHAMRAMAVLPVMSYLILQKSPRIVRQSGVLAGGALGAAIGISRLAVHAHSVSEVIAGGALGAMISVAFMRISTEMPKPPSRRWIIVLGMVGVFGTSHAEPAPTQRWIDGVALYLSGRDKPYDRSRWKAVASAKNFYGAVVPASAYNWSRLSCGISTPLARA